MLKQKDVKILHRSSHQLYVFQNILGKQNMFKCIATLVADDLRLG